ncbi:mannitol-1-phosphate 5-dehydrogenase [Alteromonas sp. D210916BOD_24]|uniref:hypothetical protein n=1 Tax=Alteromonas sp. D210916BOD_24 TaxID=3157618 RepID=UPI00399C5A39
MENYKHLHIGAGALGLGLVGFISKFVGFELAIANRPGKSFYDVLDKNLSFTLQETRLPNATAGKSSNKQDIAFDHFFFLKNNEPSVAMRQYFLDPNTVLLTSALKNTGIDALLDTLVALVRERLASKITTKVFLIAAENAVSSKDLHKLVRGKLGSALEQGMMDQLIIPIDCVVDRICNKPSISNNNLIVKCEYYIDWIIEDDPEFTDILTQLNPQYNEMFTVVDDITPYVKRKKWVVNALHLSTALLAHYYRYIGQRVDLFTKDKRFTPLFLSLTLDIWIMFAEKVKQERLPFSEQDIEAFVIETMVRISSHPQLVKDSCTRFNKATLFEFYSDFHRKVTEAYLQTVDNEDFVVIPQLIAMTTELISQQHFIRTH